MSIKRPQTVLKIGAENLIPVLLTAGLLELTWKQKAGSFPGDFSKHFCPLSYMQSLERWSNVIRIIPLEHLAGATAFPVGFGPFARTEADMIDLRTRELNNGRAAQMGILGMMVHEQLDGKPFIFFDKFEIYTPFGN